MSFTARDLVEGAQRLIGVLAVGDTMTAEDAFTGLQVLSDVLDGWSITNTMLFDSSQITVPTVIGQSDYTLGPTGDVICSRPAKIDAITYMYDGERYTIEIAPALTEWLKYGPPDFESSIISIARINYTYPNATLSIWPVPTDVGSLTLYVWSAFTEMTLDTVIDLPPGYKKALKYATAVDLVNEYNGLNVSPAVYATALDSKMTVQRLNLATPVLTVDPAVSAGAMKGVNFDIRVG